MVAIDTEGCILTVPDTGVTLRTLLACAASGFKTTPKRVWKIQYGTVVIGSVRIKTNMLKKEGITGENYENI